MAQNKINKPVKNKILKLFVTNIIVAISGFVATIILSRLLSLNDLGNYYIIFSLITIITGIVQTGLGRSVLYHTGKKIFDIKDLTSNIFILVILISIISFTIIYFTLNLWYSNNLDRKIYIFILIIIFAGISKRYIQSINTGNQNYNKLYFYKLFNSLIFPIILFVFLYTINNNLTNAFASRAITSILNLFIGYLLIKDYFSFNLQINPQIIKSLLKHGVMFGIAFLLVNLLFKSDLYMIKYFLNSKQAGLYATGVNITEKLWLFGTSAGVITFAETTNKININLKKNIAKTFLITLSGGIILFFFADIFIDIFFGKRFYESVNIIKILIPGIVFFSVFRVLNGYFSGIGKIKTIILIILPVLLLNIILNILFIPVYGIQAAAYSSSFCYIFATFIILFLNKKLTLQ